MSELITEQHGDALWLTLNRPHKRNALSMALSEALIAALEDARDREDLHYVVLRGAGEHFCAGDDISEMPQWGNANQVMRRVRRYQHMTNVLQELDKITIAAVDGMAVGGGLELTMASDFVIATERARWGMPEVDVGITPGWGGTTRMARLIGRRLTKEVNLIGALHGARRAVEAGLWNRTVPTGELDDSVNALLEVMRAKNHQAVRQLKYIIDRGVECDLETAQGFEALSGALTAAVNGWWQVADADQGAGVAGFVAKSALWRQRRGLAQHFWAQ
ncbi:enoyl-CoA hydratase/isomerase family protein [Algiphilus aromaticivorans]|uniref:enoyl-CoA hydratase/isomerase family protein n=1 Tax=Algiphilus aromaticivorans TaxID=382454 RepID=UPI0006934988|nr:enoyl-CoA hydratase/isomerase family protein [Algiphilus aromaticivorans]